jgi:hypothetical protein
VFAHGFVYEAPTKTITAKYVSMADLLLVDGFDGDACNQRKSLTQSWYHLSCLQAKKKDVALLKMAA